MPPLKTSKKNHRVGMNRMEFWKAIASIISVAWIPRAFAVTGALSTVGPVHVHSWYRHCMWLSIFLVLTLGLLGVLCGASRPVTSLVFPSECPHNAEWSDPPVCVCPSGQGFSIECGLRRSSASLSMPECSVLLNLSAPPGPCNGAVCCAVFPILCAVVHSDQEEGSSNLFAKTCCVRCVCLLAQHHPWMIVSDGRAALRPTFRSSMPSHVVSHTPSWHVLVVPTVVLLYCLGGCIRLVLVLLALVRAPCSGPTTLSSKRAVPSIPILSAFIITAFKLFVPTQGAVPNLVAYADCGTWESGVDVVCNGILMQHAGVLSACGFSIWFCYCFHCKHATPSAGALCAGPDVANLVPFYKGSSDIVKQSGITETNWLNGTRA
jgi:hypothetical protein